MNQVSRVHHFWISGLWFVILLCGLFFSNTYQFALFGIGFCLLLVWFWGIVTLRSRVRDETGIYIPRSLALYCILLFWILVFASVLHSDIPFVGILCLCLFSSMPITFFGLVIAGQGSQGLDTIKSLIKVVGPFAALLFAGLSCWALIQYFFLPEIYAGRAQHPLANPGSLAALFSLGLFSSLGWMLLAPNKLQSNAALALCVMLIGGMVATGSRGALLAVIPALLVFLYLLRVPAANHYKCLLVVLVSAVWWLYMSGLGIHENAALINRMDQGLGGDAGGSMGFFSNRENIWAGTIRMIQDHWLWGTGIGTYFLYYSEYRIPEDIYGAFMAHSDPLQYWAELGVLGPLLFYAFLAAAFIITAKAVKKISRDDPMRIWLVTSFCALGAMVFHTHVTFNLYNFSILLCSGFLLGVWFVCVQSALPESQEHKKGTALIFPQSWPTAARSICLAAPIVLMGFLFASFLSSEVLLKEARKQAFKGDLQKFSEYINAAHDIGIASNYRAYILAVTLPMGLLQTRGDALPDAEKKKLYLQAVGHLEQAEKRNPRSAAIYYYRAKLQDLVPPHIIPDTAQDPKELYERALRIDPQHASARIELMKIYQAREDVESALRVAEEGLRWGYRNLQAREFYLAAGTLYLLTKQPEKHKKVMAKLVSLQSAYDKEVEKKRTNVMEGLFGGGDGLHN